MNRPPTRNRLRRSRGFAWTAPYASWTVDNSRRQGERNACDACDGVVFWMLASYLLWIAVLLAGAASQAFVVSTTDLVDFLGSALGMTTLSAAAIVAWWYFWPSVMRLFRTGAPKMIGRYPAPPTKFATDLIAFAFPALLAAAMAILEPLSALMFVIACLAVLLILSGLRRRVGIDERCARCAYPVTTPRWSRGLCPECGCNLDARHAIILGHNARSPARLIAGTLLTAAVFALAFVT
jgi:hypothetical protein